MHTGLAVISRPLPVLSVPLRTGPSFVVDTQYVTDGVLECYVSALGATNFSSVPRVESSGSLRSAEGGPGGTGCRGPLLLR